MKQSVVRFASAVAAAFRRSRASRQPCYLPYDLSWSFFRYGQEHLARIMELALREVATAPPPVEVEVPRIVQAMTH